jgi:GTP-binding protein HflX
MITRPTAILVGIGKKDELHSSMEELTKLVETMGVEPILSLTQELKSINNATFIGKGKIQEIKNALEENKARYVILDIELSASQHGNLEKELEVTILDRTAVILEIFSQRARTKEGKIQVELARLNYAQTRLRGHGVEMSRLGGGSAAINRGPGETKLESDRRVIKEKIIKLKEELVKLEKQRDLHHKHRERNAIPQIAIAGYTNAGKSTLLNKLTNAEVFVEDKLFATLDPTTRQLHLPSGKEVIITDTVGFIEKLPHHLVKAFKSTFEEIIHADLILHVINLGDPNFDKQTKTVNEVLEEMNAKEIPVLHVYNKIDISVETRETFLRTKKEIPFVNISALTGAGIPELFDKIEAIMKDFWVTLKMKMDTINSLAMSIIMTSGKILDQKEEKDGLYMEVQLPKIEAEKVKKALGMLEKKKDFWE